MSHISITELNALQQTDPNIYYPDKTILPEFSPDGFITGGVRVRYDWNDFLNSDIDMLSLLSPAQVPGAEDYNQRRLLGLL